MSEGAGRDIEYLQGLLRRLPPVREARWAYWQDGPLDPMFVYNTGRIKSRNPDDPANGRFESAVYLPEKGSDGTSWRQLEDTGSLHHLRRDAKARALKLYEEWREHGTIEGRRVR